MARTKISEFSATAADNTDIDNIDIAEGCAPSGINNAIRELMAQLKDMQTGASGDTFTLTTVNSTTVDTTNLEVSNLKAKDGTAAGSIADSTGVVTLTSVTGTTADYTNLEVTNLKAKDGTAAGSIADSTGVVTINTLSTGGGVISPQTGFKNRIINGGMTIDQRNAGAAVTINSPSNTYTLDRWVASGQTTDGVFTVDQVTTAPTGFINSTKITVTTADASIGASQSYLFGQFVEGFNVSDLGWGTASAAAVTLSFQTRSSLTGTFGGVIHNSDLNRSYPFTYTISAANTWEYKTITIEGDTSGTWLTDSGRGLAVRFQIGAGSSSVATAGAWTGTSSILGATGATNIISTLNAEWYVTGVQLEKGSTATPFEFRSIGQELALCQRYLPAFNASAADYAIGLSGQVFSTTQALIAYPYIVQPRTAPTGITVSNGAHFSLTVAAATRSTTTAVTFNNGTLLGGVLTATVSSGLVAGNSTLLWSSNASAQILWTGCEL